MGFEAPIDSSQDRSGKTDVFRAHGGLGVRQWAKVAVLALLSGTDAVIGNKSAPRRLAAARAASVRSEIKPRSSSATAALRGVREAMTSPPDQVPAEALPPTLSPPNK